MESTMKLPRDCDQCTRKHRTACINWQDQMFLSSSFLRSRALAMVQTVAKASVVCVVLHLSLWKVKPYTPFVISGHFRSVYVCDVHVTGTLFRMSRKFTGLFA
jgi:accessory gene regulator protein AgrB